MKRKLAVLSIIVFIAASAAFGYTAWRNQHSSGFSLAAAPAYRFEPNPLQLTGNARRPVVGSSVAGGLYLLSVEGTQENSSLALRISRDEGEHWMVPQTLTAAGSSVNASSENAPQLLNHGMYAYALWLDRSSAGSRILVARSSGMDAKPPTGVSVLDKPASDTSYSGFASLGLAPNGDVYAVWLDGRDKGTPGTFGVYLARSTDKGLTFHRNVQVATDSCPCCRPSIAFGPNGKVYVAYRHVYGDNERDIAISTSDDSGEHFAPPVRVNLDRWHILGCPESGPVMAVQNGRLLVVWYSAGGQHPGLRLAQSKDGGKSFLPPFPVDASLAGANHPFMASTDDGKVALTFSARPAADDGAWARYSSFLVAISPDGKVTSPQPVQGKVDSDRYPTVALDADGTAFIATGSGSEESATDYLSRARLIQ